LMLNDNDSIFQTVVTMVMILVSHSAGDSKA